MKQPEQFEFTHTEVDAGKYSAGSYELGRTKLIAELIPEGSSVISFFSVRRWQKTSGDFGGAKNDGR